MNPKYPIYIISKGRSDTRLTSKMLERMKVPYNIVIEKQEYDDYASVIDPEKIFVLPFANLGKGSIPARNWVWDHSISIGAKKHWILDDNLRHVIRYNNNRKIQCDTGTPFRIIEKFTDRYINIAITGMNYTFFVPRNERRDPIRFNARIYSNLLIRNDIDIRWRGKYNEDTDLSIRVMKAGWVTILFNAFLVEKMGTMLQRGGNTDELYINEDEFDGRLEMARSLQRQHPEIVKITKKYGRWQHHVNYKPFTKNRLIRKKGLIIPDKINNYGLKLVNIED